MTQGLNNLKEETISDKAFKEHMLLSVKAKNCDAEGAKQTMYVHLKQLVNFDKSVIQLKVSNVYAGKELEFFG